MILILLIALSVFIICFFLPWWSLALPCLLFGYLLGQSGVSSFLYGFSGVGITWFLQTFYIDLLNNHILTDRIADMLSLPWPWLVIVITVCVGGVTGGFSTLSGYLLKQAFFNQRPKAT